MCSSEGSGRTTQGSLLKVSVAHRQFWLWCSPSVVDACLVRRLVSALGTYLQHAHAVGATQDVLRLSVVAVADGGGGDEQGKGVLALGVEQPPVAHFLDLFEPLLLVTAHTCVLLPRCVWGRQGALYKLLLLRIVERARTPPVDTLRAERTC